MSRPLYLKYPTTEAHYFSAWASESTHADSGRSGREGDPDRRDRTAQVQHSTSQWLQFYADPEQIVCH